MATKNILNLDLSDDVMDQQDLPDDETHFGEREPVKVSVGVDSCSSPPMQVAPSPRHSSAPSIPPTSPRSLRSPKGKAGGARQWPGKVPKFSLDEDEKDEEVEEKEITYDRIREDVQGFVANRLEKGQRLHCVVLRKKGGFMGNDTYEVHIDRNMHDFGHDGEMLLMYGKRQSRNVTSNYHIHTSHRVSPDTYVGKVRSNWMGTEFVIYDDGINPKDAGKANRMKPIRLELGAVMYERNTGSNPREMTVVMPNRPENSGKGGTVNIIARVKANDTQDIFTLTQKQPVWSEENQSFMLDFYGRVTNASVKNFMLLNPDAAEAYKKMSKDERTKTELSGTFEMEDVENISLLFGRTAERDLFVMDISWPLSPVQAFAIVLTSFDSKLGCE